MVHEQSFLTPTSLRYLFLMLTLACMLLIPYSNSYSTMPAVWTPSPALNAFTISLVNNIGSGSPYTDPTQVDTLTPYPAGLTFTQAPRLVASIVVINLSVANIGMQGLFAIVFHTLGAQTTTNFKITHNIVSSCWAVSYRILALDRTFPYHLNLFTNVNSINSATINSRMYLPVVMNYMSMAGTYSYAYTQFRPVNGTDYSMNRIIGFLSCFDYRGVTPFPQVVDISFTILNATHFRHQFTFGDKINLGKYHFNMIVYDQAQLLNTGLFKLHYAHVNFTDVSGGQYPVPPQYQNITMMGWTDFSGITTNLYVTFNLNFANLTNQPANATVTYGIKMLPPVPQNYPTNMPATTVGVSLFYMQYLICTNVSYFLDTSTQLCVQCSYIPQCQSCLNSTYCTACMMYYMLNSSYLCQQITCPNITNCLLCLNQTACAQCDYYSSYALNPYTLTCDYCDNNQNMYINMASTSKECMNCSQVYCDFLNSYQDVTIAKQGCNGFVISILDQSLTVQKIQSTFIFVTPSISVTTIIQNSTTQYYQIHATYSADIPANTPILFQISSKMTSINYSSIIPTLYYTDNECQASQTVKELLHGYVSVSYVVLAVSLVCGKIVGLQLFGVLQISYFILSQHSYLNLYLSPLLNFKMFNGLNVKVFDQQQSQTNPMPQILRNMGIYSNFINNCNIMLLVFYGYLVLTGVCLLIFKLIKAKSASSSTLSNNKRNKIQYYCAHALKQGMLTLILFNSFNVSFSSAVHWKYADPTDNLYSLNLVLSIATLLISAIIMLSMQFTQAKTYGQFKNKFKNCESQIYIPLLFVFRTVMGVYCALQSQYQYGIIFIIGFSMLFTLYVIINLPFVDVWQNYRTVFVQATILYIVFIADYYKTMKSNTPMIVKGRIYGPAIGQLVLMGICIIISTIVLIREIYQFIKNCRNSNKNMRVINQSYSKQHHKSVSVQSQYSSDQSSQNIENNQNNYYINSNNASQLSIHINRTEEDILNVDK